MTTRIRIDASEPLHSFRLAAAFTRGSIGATDAASAHVAERVCQEHATELLSEAAVMRAQGRARRAEALENQARGLASAWGL